VASVGALEDRLVQLGKDHDAGLISRREWLERRAPMQERIEVARKELDTEQGDGALEQFAGDRSVRTRWAKLTIDQQRAVVRALIEQVTIAPPVEGGPRNVFDPDRVEVEWRI